MESVWIWILVAVCYAGTAACWVRIFKSDDIVVFKVAGLLFSAVPIVGPFLFLFLDMPRQIPEGARAKLDWRTGTTPYTEIRRKLFEGNRRHIASLFGLRSNEGDGNREYRRSVKRSGNSNGN